MRRRDFIKGIAVSTTWPLAASAQQTDRIRTVGILLGSAENPEMQRLLGAFEESFKALGWTENRNVRFEFVGAALIRKTTPFRLRIWCVSSLT